jgi:lysozyme
MIEGIDVSNHQSRVDWELVKAHGIEFAYIKATEGVGYVDPKFGAFSAGAAAAGIPHGFYHFARPDTHSGTTPKLVTGDAQAEADAFLAVAFPRSGQLLPVLDLEVGGLAPELLVTWTTAWLARIKERAGVDPIIYTFPSFWTQLGNTNQFSSFRLWISNTGVVSPHLPDGFKTYTIWQHSTNGTVPGISGVVDLDRLGSGVTLAQITFEAATTPPPQNLAGPVPKPAWFWLWVRWRLGVAEFEGLQQNEGVRPDEIPDAIPQWAWQSLSKLSTKPASPSPTTPTT